MFFVAEEVGFEPTRPRRVAAFQAAALDHYATPPNLVYNRHIVPNYYVISKPLSGLDFLLYLGIMRRL
jgi:hypothetical protein